MSKKVYSKHDLQTMLRGFVLAFPNQTAAAKALQCDPAQLSKMLSGERDVTESIALNFLKIKKEVIYLEV